MAIDQKEKENDQPGRDKPNESENQPQFASEDEARPERELGSAEEDEPEEVSAGAVLPGPNGRPGARVAAGASDPDEAVPKGLGDDRKPPNADD